MDVVRVRGEEEERKKENEERDNLKRRVEDNRISNEIKISQKVKERERKIKRMKKCYISN